MLALSLLYKREVQKGDVNVVSVNATDIIFIKTWSERACDKGGKGFSAPCVQVRFSPSPSCAQRSPGTRSPLQSRAPAATWDLGKHQDLSYQELKTKVLSPFHSVILFLLPKGAMHWD